MQETEVKPVTISKLSGKLTSPTTPGPFSVTSLAYLKTAPTAIDETTQTVQVDTLCTGAVGPLTPAQDMRTAYVIHPESIMPDDRDQEDILKWWEEKGIEKYSSDVGLILLHALTGECTERSSLVDIGSVELTIMKPEAGDEITRSFSLWHQSKSSGRIVSIKVYLDGKELKTLAYKKQGGLTDITDITLPEDTPRGTHELKVVALDEK